MSHSINHGSTAMDEFLPVILRILRAFNLLLFWRFFSWWLLSKVMRVSFTGSQLHLFQWVCWSTLKMARRFTYTTNIFKEIFFEKRCSIFSTNAWNFQLDFVLLMIDLRNISVCVYLYFLVYLRMIIQNQVECNFSCLNILKMELWLDAIWNPSEEKKAVTLWIFWIMWTQLDIIFISITKYMVMKITL